MPGIMSEGSGEGSVPRYAALPKNRFGRRGVLGRRQFVTGSRPRPGTGCYKPPADSVGPMGRAIEAA